jgi:hypothetical protein
MDDQRLAAIITALDQVAAREAFVAAGWMASGWSNPSVRRFLLEHAPKEPRGPI